MYEKPDYRFSFALNNVIALRLQVQEFVREQQRQPLSLQKLSLLSIRRSVGGVRFQVRVRTLPLPTSMQNFVIGM